VLGLALLLTLLPLGLSAQDNARSDAVASTVGWLLDQQADDGGFPGLSGESDPGTTADAILALVAARSLGIDTELAPALNYLAENALVYAQTNPGSAAKLALTLSAAGLDPHDFNKVDPLAIVQAAAANGLIGFGPYEHALGILALAAAGEAIADETIAVAMDTQGEDGGWAFDGSVEAGAADTNTTALMVQGLIAAGLSDGEAVAGGIDYLLASQDAEGGFPNQPGGDVDAN
jgi:prenyltransferase beta subunit